MFDMKELEKGLKMAQERETIRVNYEDGREVERKANIWTLCGIDNEGRAEFTMGKVALVGGDEVVKAAITHAAQLMLVANDIKRAVVRSVPGMTEKKFMKLAKYAEKALREKNQEEQDA